MKKSALLVCLLAIIPFSGLLAQDQKDDWRQRMMSEKIGFITEEISLTPEEAQVFWPVYNQFNQKREEAFRNVGKAFHDLEVALEEGKEGKSLSSLLDAYTEALENSHRWEQEASATFRKVLTEDKVVKLFVAEEHFRRTQIKKLNRPQR